MANIGEITREFNNILTDRESQILENIKLFRLDFENSSNKEKKWKYLLDLTNDKNSFIISGSAALALDEVFPYLTDKDQVWNNLIDKIRCLDSNNQYIILKLLGKVFPHVTNKGQAWNDLINLTKDFEFSIQMAMVPEILGKIFPFVTDKDQAWTNLLTLTKHENFMVQKGAIEALGFVLPYIKNKEQATKYLLALIDESNFLIKGPAVKAIAFAFPYITDKEVAIKKILVLEEDKDSIIKEKCPKDAFNSASPEERELFKKGHLRMKNSYSLVQQNVAFTLGIIFPHVIDKKNIWECLMSLTNHQNRDVRISANYSAGKISIFKATIVEDDDNFRDQLEKALEYFEKSVNESKMTNYPAKFCFPFYRSFHAIIFKKEESETEVKKSIQEAKDAIEGHESRSVLLEAIEYLSNALNEAQKARDNGIDFKKSNLDKIRIYLERYDKLLDLTKEKTPGAALLMRKGDKIVKKNIKELIVDIQEKAKIVFEDSKGTPSEEIASAINHEVKKWYIRDRDQELMTKNVESLISTLNLKTPLAPEFEHIRTKIEEIKEEPNLTKQFEIINKLIELIPTMFVQIGDKYEVSDINGENIQIGGKGNKINEHVAQGKPVKKSWSECLNFPVTFAAFTGFIITEIGTSLYPISYNHLISVGVAFFILLIGVAFIRR